ALGTIERILNWRYGFQPFPTRGAAKKGACRSSSQTASANGKPTRIAKGNNIVATAISSNRLFLGPIIRPCAIQTPIRVRDKKDFCFSGGARSRDRDSAQRYLTGPIPCRGIFRAFSATWVSTTIVRQPI